MQLVVALEHLLTAPLEIDVHLQVGLARVRMLHSSARFAESLLMTAGIASVAFARIGSFLVGFAGIGRSIVGFAGIGR